MQNVKERNTKKRVTLAILSVLLCFILPTATGQAQNFSNTAFKSGETLQYDLFYNWKFVWIKAGSATMSITSTSYQDRPSYRTRLLTRGSSQADRFFVLRDTLTSIVSQDDMLPRYYSKTDMENKSYRQRKVWYSYSSGKSHIKQLYINPYGATSWKNESNNLVIFDMLSIMLRARSFDTSDFTPGHKIKFVMTDGDGADNQTLIYRGKKDLKMKNNSTTYRCLVLSFVEYNKGKEKEVVTFYVTDDANHIPVRLDLFLNFGTAKAYLVGHKSIRNPITSKIK